MSVQAELVRLGLRCLLKPGNRADMTIIGRRQKEANFERWVPRPPVGTEVTSDAVGGIRALRVATAASRQAARHVLYLHGGGYVTGDPALYRHLLWRFAEAAAARVVAIAYRLAPEHPFPAALDDATAAWHGMVAEGADPGRIAILGDSAGGGLTLALALRLRDEAAAQPAALAAMSPWTDLALTGPSLRGNAAADPMMNADDVPQLAASYLAGADPRHPYASPLYGDPTGLPPTLIQVGSDEILRDDAVRMAERMRAAGCVVELEVWRRMPHVFQAFAMVMPEARRAIARIGAFVRRHAG
ncbi:MAG TPA: alpha/beta hydrolase [Stellaceae bacterium]|nr:alpha/beta hydrolase [Stellaceae bacterium]